jgi:hypothetical protein
MGFTTGRGRRSQPERRVALFVGVIIGFGLLLVGAVLGVVSPTIDVQGQVNLYEAVTRTGPDGCSGQGAYADLREGKKIRVSAGRFESAPSLSAGYRWTDGACIFQFRTGVPKGRRTYVIDTGHGEPTSFGEADLSRPVVLIIGSPSPP